jgi:hypothetical protein
MARILKLSPEQKEKETEELRRKYEEKQMLEKRWDEFKSTFYYEMMMRIVDEEIEKARSLESLPHPKSVSDFSELGQLTAVQMKVFYTLKEGIRQRLINGC